MISIKICFGWTSPHLIRHRRVIRGNEMRQHERFDTRCLRYFAYILFLVTTLIE
jgi:hypothetical protein